MTNKTELLLLILFGKHWASWFATDSYKFKQISCARETLSLNQVKFEYIATEQNIKPL
jgi:hypothetical protein